MKAPDHSPAATAVLVLGMHRSGTSALAGSLQRLQVPLGSQLVAPWHDNPAGYFEHAGVVTAHETLLAELGQGWESLQPMPDQWLESQAAHRAADQLEALLREDFGDAALWAVKDPRLSRLLPLWHRVLARLQIRPVHIYMLRHPDEVAGSLAHRDGMSRNYAYLLWLQYFLEAEGATRSQARTLLTYERLLAQPVDSLRDVARALQLTWPCAPENAGLREVLDPAQRHHIAQAAGRPGAAGGAAHDLYQQAQSALAAGSGWPQGDAQRRVLDRYTRRLTPWIGGLNQALARQRLAGVSALRQYQGIEQALAQAQALSLQRMEDLRVLDQRLRRSEETSIARLQELEALAARLALTDEALQATEAQSLQRLRESQALALRLARTDSALQATAAESLERLGELQAVADRLKATDAALHVTEAQSLQRLGELEALATRLARTDAALVATEAQSLDRLQDIASLTDRVALTDAALGEAQTMALDRLQQIASLDLRLGATDKALAAAQGQAHAHLSALQDVQRQLVAVQAETIFATGRLGELEAQLRLRDERLQALHASLAWRLSRPLRWLGRCFGRRGHGWDPT